MSIDGHAMITAMLFCLRCVAFDLDGLLWRPSLAQLGVAELALHCSWPNSGGSAHKSNTSKQKLEVGLPTGNPNTCNMRNGYVKMMKYLVLCASVTVSIVD